MNNITKLIEILQKEQIFNREEKLNQLKNLSEQLSSPENYTEQLIISLNFALVEEEKFNDADIVYEFLLNFAKLDQNAKNYFLALEMTDSDKKAFNLVNEKILRSKEFYEQKKNEKIDIDNLIRKLDDRKKQFITQHEIEFIIKVITDKFDIIQQIDILKKINEKNIKAFNNYNILQESIEGISEDDLEETNISCEDVEKLLIKYKIDYSEFSSEEKEKLSKYGNLERMELILQFLEKEKIIGSDIILPSEIITKTLLYSTIENLVETKEKNDIDFRELVRKIPTVLYPALNEKKYSKKIEPGKATSTNKSGTMNNYNKNSELLKSLKIPFNEIWNKCFSFFTQSYKANKNSIDCLKSYGISLYDDSGNLKSIFSVLGNRNPSIIDIYDIALESSAKDYVLSCPSSMSPSQLYKFYLIKLAKKMGLEEKDIFRTYVNQGNKIILNSSNLRTYSLPETLEEIYESYDAATINIPNKKVYDNIFEISDLNMLPDYVLEDKDIKSLEKFSESDELYNFNGIKVSKKKVLRRYAVLKNNGKAVNMSAIMYCILYGSMLTENEFKNIYDLVKGTVSFEPDDEIKVIPKQKLSDDKKM